MHNHSWGVVSGNFPNTFPRPIYSTSFLLLTTSPCGIIIIIFLLKERNFWVILTSIKMAQTSCKGNYVERKGTSTIRPGQKYHWFNCCYIVKLMMISIQSTMLYFGHWVCHFCLSWTILLKILLVSEK